MWVMKTCYQIAVWEHLSYLMFQGPYSDEKELNEKKGGTCSEWQEKGTLTHPCEEMYGQNHMNKDKQFHILESGHKKRKEREPRGT